MKKVLLLSMIFLGINCISFSGITFAEGAMNVHAEINSRIFSTQGAQPLENLERTHYTNQGIMQIEQKQKTVIEPEQKDENIVPVQNKDKKKGCLRGFFEGFRVIW